MLECSCLQPASRLLVLSEYIRREWDLAAERKDPNSTESLGQAALEARATVALHGGCLPKLTQLVISTSSYFGHTSDI